jgi:Arc/MetJ-type ribon-helix-helix transcriptional regulator
MTRVAIQLPDELSQFVNNSVQAGDYPSADDFFISVVSMYKDQVEERLSESEEAKLAVLRAEIQIAVDQAERGEVIRNFDVNEFLAERHATFAKVQGA